VADWRQAFVLGEQVPAPTASAEPDEGHGPGPLRRLRERLGASRRALAAELRASVLDRLEDADWERLEEALILADMGAPATARVVAELEAEVEAGGLSDPAEVRERLVDMLAELGSAGDRRIDVSAKPSVVMVVGVNGTGKTTTIGKLAWVLRNQLDLSVVLAASDTYRAAAVEQLEVWAERAGAEIIRAAPGGDPGAVAYDAIEAAKARGADVVICDTAGRLHTHGNLMEELAKVRRVISKRLEGAPHESLIVIDATTGQNGLRQAQAFSRAAGLTGVALTKLDGTAKGGIALAIADELEIPVKLIGVGEGIDDLRPFEPREFAQALLEE